MSLINANKQSNSIHRQHDDWDEVHNQLLSVQKKSLEINDPNDAHEKEADAVAQKVVDGQSAQISGNNSNSENLLQRKELKKDMMIMSKNAITVTMTGTLALTNPQTTALNNIGTILNNYANTNVTVHGGSANMADNETGQGALDAITRANLVAGALSLTLPPIILPNAGNVARMNAQTTPPLYAADYELLGPNSDIVIIKLLTANGNEFPNNILRQLRNQSTTGIAVG